MKVIGKTYAEVEIDPKQVIDRLLTERSPRRYVTDIKITDNLFTYMELDDCDGYLEHERPKCRTWSNNPEFIKVYKALQTLSEYLNDPKKEKYDRYI